jgi:anti-sigma-K factor RskA
MTDFERLEEKASLYIMGDMAEADRREFAAQIAESAELAQLVRELEEGAVAVGLACPPRRPPPFLWRAIEKSVEQERRKIIPLFSPELWRNAGWAAAAACLAAWIFFGVVRDGKNPFAEAKNKTPDAASAHTTASAAATAREIEEARRTNELAANRLAREQTEARDREAQRLRNDVANLQRRVGEMSQVLTQQQAMLGEPNRIKFLTLTPAANATSVQNLSPELQRALFLAMARELGWLNTSNQIAAPFQDSPPPNGAEDTMDVEFVDFRGGTNGVITRFQVEKPKSTASGHKTESNLADIANENPSMQLAALPAFVTPDQVVVALDNSVAASGSTLNFTVHSGGEATVLGSATMGAGPMVLRFNNTIAVDGWTFQVTTPGAAGPGFIFFTPSAAP